MDTEDLLRLSSTVAWRYKNRCWWADLEDLKQQAVQTICELTHFDPQVGVEFEGYAYRACIYALSRYLWSTSGPVSVKARPQKGELERAPYEDEEHTTYDDIEQRDWRRKVNIRIVALVQQLEDGDMALRVLLSEERPREVSTDRQRVYKAVARAKAVLQYDTELYGLWKQQKGTA